MHPPIGFKTAEPAYTDGIVDRFYRPLIAAGIAPVVMSIDSAGHCYDVWKLVAGTALQNAAVMHFRRTGDPTSGEPNGMDVANYDADPVADANRMYDWHMSRWPKELPKEVVWTQFTNEPRKEAHDWLARHGLQLCRRALADGRRITLFGWAAGTPEPEAWYTTAARELLDLCRRYPDRLAIALNEYSYRADTLDGPALIGRWQAIPKPWPAIFITEHGWAYDSAPAAGSGIPQLLETYRKWYAYPHIKGLALWTLDKGRGGKQLPYTINAYMTPLAEAIIANDVAPIEEPAEPPPAVEPPPIPTEKPNLLKNPSFEEGWSDSTAFPGQHPAGWEMAWNVGSGFPNPYAPAQPYMAGEAVHKTAAMLPAEERGQFVWDGDTTYKIFGAGTKAFWGRLKQTLALPAGRYRLTTPVWVDCYRWDTTHKRKDYNVEPRQAETMVKVNDKEVRPWTALKSGQRHDVVTEFDHPGGDVKLAVHLRANWQISNNFWLDGWRLEAITPEPPTPPPPAPPPAETAVKIADISKWQGAIKPAVMKTAGIHAVIPRASYGTTRDQNFDLYMGQLCDAGLPVPAVYHYYEPRLPWRQQLDTLLAAMRRHGGARAAVDLEDMNFAPATATRSIMAAPAVTDASPEARRRRNRQRMIELGIDPDQTGENAAALEALPATVQPVLVEDVRLFLEALDREMPLPGGYAHIIYTNYSYWLNIMGKPDWGAQYQLWIAAWTTAARPAVPAPWATSGRSWTLWQHTSSAGGQTHGVQSDRLDLNRFNGTAEAFERWATVPAVTPAPSLEETLRAAATPLPRYINPTFALPAAIIARGQQVNSPEAQASHGGIAYTLELGLDAKTGAESIYYARTGDWQNVRSVPLKPPQPAAPAADGIDLLPYLLGDGRLYEMKVVRPDGVHSQQVQTLREGGGRFYHLKNRQWEELWANGQFIYRGTDTSFSEDTYYTLRDEPGGYGSRWCPRTMKPGDIYERNPLVTFYYKRGCVKRTGPGYTEGRQRSWLQLVKRHASYLAGGVLLNDVVELRWLDKPIGGVARETYFYARGYGLVAWSAAPNLYSHIIAEFEPGEREPMSREVIPCLVR